MKIKLEKFSQTARTPTQATSGSAGFDPYSTDERVVLAFSFVLIQTDLGFKIPRGHFRKIHPRSSWAIQFTGVGGGVIDLDYRSNVIVISFNFLYNYYQICQGDKFAEIVFQNHPNYPKLEEVGNFNGRTCKR